MAAPSQPLEGLGRRLRHLGDLGLALVENRLALAAAEVEGRIVLLQRLLAWGAVVALCAAMGLQALALAVIVWFWDTHRMAAIVSVAAFFMLAAGVGLLVLRHLVRHTPTLLAGSLDELRADRQHLAGRSTPADTAPPGPSP